MRTVVCLLLLSIAVKGYGQCASNSNIYSFAYSGHFYEVVKEKKSWSDAVACAIERGGYLLELNDSAELDSVYYQLENNAGITVSATTAPDGGGASYVWTGGNDRDTEGKWVWANSGTQFWTGTTSGSAVGGSYVYWGSLNSHEPDNYLNKQDALGLALTDWPNGKKSEWNDIDEQNTLYYVIEYSHPAGVNTLSTEAMLTLAPNPSRGIVSIRNGVGPVAASTVCIYNALGVCVLSAYNTDKVDVAYFPKGVYSARISIDGRSTVARQMVVLP